MTKQRAPSTTPISGEPLEQEVFLAILKTSEFLLGELQQLLKPNGLSAALYNVLRILRGAGAAGLPCSEIAVRMVQRDPDITRLVDRLERTALVRRERQDTDRRVVRVVLATAGRKLLGKLDAPVLDLHRRQLRHLGAQRLRELARLLEDARTR